MAPKKTANTPPSDASDSAAPKITASTSSSDAKLDALIASVDALTRSQQELLRSQEDTKSLLETSLQRVVKLEQDVSSISANQAASTAHLAAHDKDILSLKIASNANEQLMKSSNIRILGYPVLDEETTAAADGGRLLRDKIFSRVIGPILDSAVRDRFILSPVPAQEAILKIYRAGRISAGSKSSPPPIVVTLSSPLIRQTIFRYKSKSLPVPNTVEKAAGAKRYYIVEDLTKPTHRLLKLLQGHDSVDKVWTIDGLLRFTKTGDDTIHRVNNVFESIENILTG